MGLLARTGEVLGVTVERWLRSSPAQSVVLRHFAATWSVETTYSDDASERSYFSDEISARARLADLTARHDEWAPVSWD